jgi:outer membrane protein
MRLFSFVLASALAFAVPVAAQDRSFNFALGAGIGLGPEYLGSDSYEGAVFPTFTFGSLKWGALDIGNGVRNAPDNGFSVNGAFRVLGDRTTEDSPELVGLDDIDIAVELGVGVSYQETNWMVFGEVRKGVTGHSGVTGTIGSDFITRPGDRWKFTMGPRVNFGDDEFADTYFGVATPTANFGSFNASGGALSAGVLLTGSYYINDKWSLDGGISYEKLLGDAADSPITVAGSEDQWRIAIGVSRIFNLNF